MFTYQTRPSLSEREFQVLVSYADLYGRVERKLYAALAAGNQIDKLKSSFLKEYGITSRQFNSIAIGLKGKISSIKERRKGLIKESETRIVKASKVIKKLEKREPGTNILHQKKRRLVMLQSRLAVMKQDHVSGKVRLCFGSRKLFRAQFSLELNGYQSLDDWRNVWKASRSSSFFVIGSKGESGGCQGCVAISQGDGSLTLRLRLPNALQKYGKYLVLPNIRFAYGQGKVLESLAAGRAISYRFLKDEKGWRVFASTEVSAVQLVTQKLAGAIGIDLNPSHLAVTEIDRFGNLVSSFKVPCLTYGKTTNQAKAIIGDAVKTIVERALKTGKPIAIEKLDFSKKKAELEILNPRESRRLSSFAYSKTSEAIRSSCFRQGVEVVEVNPAYTSVIGAVNFAQRLGISVHMGASVAIARRSMRLRESPTVKQACVPVRNGGHVTFLLPVRSKDPSGNRKKHVWSFWSGAQKSLKAAHKVYYRSEESKTSPAPLPPKRKALGDPWYLSVKARQANRFQNCLGDVVDEGVLVK